ncbi:MAG: phenylalanine--tRNA ligase subunit beta [Acidobacteria bacterium]|nr:phenylalanine--tRNA ligase subunit beta [Acidobacteriota bacterium]
MKVLLSWLREFVDVRVETARLAEDLTLAGLAVDAVEGRGEDAVLDLDVTTNRVDCMNVHGVAREVSVLYGLPLKPLEASFAESGAASADTLEVLIEAPDLCPRFCARVLDVRLGPSPSWIRDRLEVVGVRPINNVVDLTNYVMIEMGHPSHAFDLARIPEGKLRVRWGREGERLTTLDGVARTLAPRVGVVAGMHEALALAGIMGGASSEVSETTRTVALEAAYWEPLAIRRAAKTLSLRTEASHRFERGADPEGPPVATARIAHLLQKIGAGTSRPGLIDSGGARRAPRTAQLRTSRVTLVLGTKVPEARGREILTGLGFRTRGREADAEVYEVPTWRGDVSREVDLVEEVARHHGLASIPSTVPPSRGVEGLRPWQVRERAVRETMVAAGLTEVASYSFVSEAEAAADPAPRVALRNPLSADQGVLRSSLVIPGLLGALRTNLRYGRRDVGIFEIGRVFGPGEPLPREERRLGILLSGAAMPAHWSQKARAADVFDVKGILDALAARLGLGALRVAPEGLPPFVHPGKSARILRGSEALGWLGALHPDLASAWELRDEAVAAEIALDGILAAPASPARFRPLPRFPEVSRDLSIVCDAASPAADVESRIHAAGGDLLRGVRVTDRYEGPPVPAGRVSLTVALRYHHPERTLAGEEVEESVDRVVRALRAAGAEIRGE